MGSFRQAPQQPQPEEGGLFSAAGHVVDEGSIDIRTAATDRIEQRICVRHKIFVVGQFVSDNLCIAGFAEHHQTARHSDSFSSCTRRHVNYTDPF